MVVVACTQSQDFDWVLKFLSQPSLTFSSPASALAALAAAHRFLCCGLAEVAGTYLAARLSQANVLAVVTEVVAGCPQEAGGLSQGAQPVLSPPPAPPPPVSVCCSNLRAASLAFLDRNITTITGSRAWLELDVEVVQAVLCRSSLHISSELDLVSGLARWLEAGQTSSPGGLQYLIRYLTLTPDQFRTGPMMVSGLLTEEESDALLLALVRPDSHPALPDHLQPLERTMRQHRRSSQADSELAETPRQNVTDLKISRLQELKEKEKVYKESYTLVDDLVLCLRCLLD